MRWKKKNNKPANFSYGVGGGMGVPMLFMIIKKPLILGKIKASGGHGGSK